MCRRVPGKLNFSFLSKKGGKRQVWVNFEETREGKCLQRLSGYAYANGLVECKVTGTYKEKLMHSPLKNIQAQKFQNPVVVINPCLAEI